MKTLLNTSALEVGFGLLRCACFGRNSSRIMPMSYIVTSCDITERGSEAIIIKKLNNCVEFYILPHTRNRMDHACRIILIRLSFVGERVKTAYIA